MIALVGDGAMQMNGINGLITIANYWKEWSDPRLIVLVLANRDLNQVTWEQRVMSGDPKFESLAGRARFRLRALRRLARPERHPRREARGRRPGLGPGAAPPTGRCVMRRVTDPEVPPLPPHITFEQAVNFTEVDPARATRTAAA